MIGNKYILAALLACAPLASQAAPATYTFDSITAIEHGSSSGLVITGVLVNDTVPTTLAMPMYGSGGYLDRCTNLFNVVLSLPSVYLLSITVEVNPNPSPGFPALTFQGCKATAKP